MASLSNRRHHWPALDITLPSVPHSIAYTLDALIDDCDVFAIEEGEQSIDRSLNPTASANVRRIYFFSASARNDAALTITTSLGNRGVQITIVDVPDERWAERSQQTLNAVHVGDIIVAPPWDKPDTDDKGRLTIQIEPSMGFGTGHHESTRLCLRALQRYSSSVAASSHLLDIGTGSGILAIAASKLGARTILAIDRDEDALANAAHNISTNGATEHITLVKSDLCSLENTEADFVTANLAPAVFKNHSNHIAHQIKPSSLLIASGLTLEDEEGVRRCLASNFNVVDRISEGAWIALVLKRRKNE